MAKKELMSGNEAMAEAAVRAGCNFFASYPITPQTSILEYLSTRMFEVGGEFVQAESEVAAINMVMGASAAGARVMTATAGMAVSLMMETLSWMVAARYPSVVINLQRSGAGSGGIKSSQTDFHYATKSMGHGGLHAYVVSPAYVQEAVDLVYKGFAFAEKYRCMVYVLTDSMVGQVLEPVELPDFQQEFAPREWCVSGKKGRAARKLNVHTDFSHKNLAAYRSFEKMYETWAKEEVQYEEYCMEDAETVIVAWGMGARIARGAVNLLRNEGVKAGLFRPITLYPFPSKQIASLDPNKIKNIVVAEVAVPTQMYDDVDNAVRGKIPLHKCDCCWLNVFSEEDIADYVRKTL